MLLGWVWESATLFCIDFRQDAASCDITLSPSKNKWKQLWLLETLKTCFNIVELLPGVTTQAAMKDY